jgi:hypothetical protein
VIGHDERDRIKRFVDAVGRSPLSPEAISEAVGGNPSGPTIRRYMRGDLPKKRLDPETRRGIDLFLTGRNHSGGDGREQPALQNAEWLPRLLELVLTGDYGKEERLELTQQINAAARMQNALWEAAAAYRRAGAMQLEGGAALGRASGIEEEAKSASARALSIAPQQPGAAHPSVPTQTPTPTDEGEGEQGGQRKAV